MSRIRSIHPGLLTDEAFMALTVECPLAIALMLGLWIEADDSGTFEWKLMTLKARILPASSAAIGELIATLERGNMVRRFTIGGREFGVIRNFVKFQRPKKPADIHPFTAETRAYAGFVGDKRPRSGTGRPPDDHGEEEVPSEFGTGSGFGRQREEEGGRREDVDSHPPTPGVSADANSGEKRFGELTGAQVIPLPTADPVEAEARAAMRGLKLAEDGDFSAVSAALAEPGVTRTDLAVALEEARSKGERCPRSWRGFAGFVATAARQRRDREERGAAAPRASPGAAPASGLAVCLELARADSGAPMVAAPGRDPGLERLLARMRSALAGGDLAADQAPDERERERLCARLAALDPALAPAGLAEAERQVAALFAKNSAGLPPPRETREQLRLFGDALKGQPVWAIASGCDGVIGSGQRFRPTTGELVGRVGQLAAPVWAEAKLIRAVLAAEIARRPSAERRATQVAAFRARSGPGFEARGGAA